jgi:hypothetical protein
MNKLGTYSTIDCPTDRIDEAYDFLSEKFGAIGGTVRRVSNSHDFGPYPSFEIDYPDHLEYVDEDPYLEDDEELDDETQDLIDEKFIWIREANAIEQEYSKEFADYL